MKNLMISKQPSEGLELERAKHATKSDSEETTNANICRTEPLRATEHCSKRKETMSWPLREASGAQASLVAGWPTALRDDDKLS